MIEPALPIDEPVLGQKQSSGFDMSLIDDQALEEQRRLMEQISARQAMTICKFCDKGISDDQGSLMLQSTDCFHSVHLDCFKQFAKVALTSNQVLPCPECGKSIQQFEMKNYLSEEEIQEIEKSQVESLVAKN